MLENFEALKTLTFCFRSELSVHTDLSFALFSEQVGNTNGKSLAAESRILTNLGVHPGCLFSLTWKCCFGTQLF